MSYRSAHNACPACDVALRRVEHAAVVAKACDGCGGVFLDIAGSMRISTTLDLDLIALADELSRNGQPPRSEGTRACPECASPMMKVRVETAACTIDACPTDGTWFDARELADVTRALARQRRKTFSVTPSVSVPSAVPALAAAATDAHVGSPSFDSSLIQEVGKLFGSNDYSTSRSNTDTVIELLSSLFDEK